MYRHSCADALCSRKEGHHRQPLQERALARALLAEDDELYNLRIAKSFDGRYLLVRSSSKESSEVHYLDLRHEMGSKGMSLAKNLVCIAKRKHKVLYRVTHCQGYWLVQTNIGGLPNLSLKACRVGEEGMEAVSSSTNTQPERD